MIKRILLVIMLFFSFVSQSFADEHYPHAVLSIMQKTQEGELPLGQIEIQLDLDKSPISVKNFADYVNSGFYDGTLFHRVIPGFMIQGGGFDPKMQQKTTRAPIVNEAENGLRNLRGTLAMARTAEKDSATSQFFINVVDNSPLDYSQGNAGYAVFGKVVKGMDVVDRIAAMPTHTVGAFDDVPVNPIIISAAKMLP